MSLTKVTSHVHPEGQSSDERGSHTRSEFEHDDSPSHFMPVVKWQQTSLPGQSLSLAHAIG
jgi:hypothetical protein